ncbi:hypothetical protein LOS20_13860 [Enterococcus faecium]|nr:hypothetical protein [Enterococcus faecium]
MADSGGAIGHTGVITGGGKNITSTCYYTQGEKILRFKNYVLIKIISLQMGFIIMKFGVFWRF